jgi:hypothetical protein
MQDIARAALVKALTQVLTHDGVTTSEKREIAELGAKDRHPHESRTR